MAIYDIVIFSQTLAQAMQTKSSKKYPAKSKKKRSRRKPKMDETDYLLSNPVNAAHLLRAIRAAERGELIKRDLIEVSKK